MSETTITQTKDEMLTLLKEGICEVNFLKANGDKRVMYCTLAEQYLPEIDPDKERKRTAVDGPGLITCFDMENEGWRRFTLDNLTEEVKRRPDLGA
jgi:hypothetical protein